MLFRTIVLAVALAACMGTNADASPIFRITVRIGGLLEPELVRFDIDLAQFDTMRDDFGQQSTFQLLRWTTPTGFGDDFASQFASPVTVRTSTGTSQFNLAPDAAWGEPDPLGNMRFHLTMTESLGDAWVSRRLYWDVFPTYAYHFGEFDDVLHVFPNGGHILEQAYLPGTGPLPYRYGGFSLVDIAPIPEPTTLLLVGCGGVWVVRRRWTGR